jgi:hypothetical protein
MTPATKAGMMLAAFMARWTHLPRRIGDLLPCRHGVLSAEEEDEFCNDDVHGLCHGISVAEQALRWTTSSDGEHTANSTVVALAALIHDVKGLGASGNQARKNHHLFGAKLASQLLGAFTTSLQMDGGTVTARVPEVIERHRGVPPDYPPKGYPDGFLAPAAANMPQPVLVEDKLVRDADTYDELFHQEQMRNVTA